MDAAVGGGGMAVMVVVEDAIRVTREGLTGTVASLLLLLLSTTRHVQDKGITISNNSHQKTNGVKGGGGGGVEGGRGRGNRGEHP